MLTTRRAPVNTGVTAPVVSRNQKAVIVPWAWSPGGAAIVGTTALMLAVSVLLRRRAGDRELPWLAMALAAAVVWSVAYGIELTATSATAGEAWGDLKYVGICALPPAWVMFVSAYTDRMGWLRRGTVALLLVEPLTVLVLLANTHTHDLIRGYPARPGHAASGGVLFWPHTVYTYVLLWGATAALVARLRRLSPVYRRQTTILLATLFVPFATNLLFNLSVPPFDSFDLTPFAFVAAGAVLVWAALRFRHAGLNPIARSHAFMQIRDLVLTLDTVGRVVDANAAATSAFELPAERLVGQGLPSLLPRAPGLLDGREPVRTAEHSLGGRIYELTASSVRDRRGRLVATVVTGHDISDRKAVEARLAHHALHDPLTGCANRTLLFERLTHALDHARRTRRQVAVLFIDLDGFKAVNDGLGHAVGDQVLVEVARRVSRAVRRDDTVARMGGDEFAVLLEDISGEAEPARVAAHIEDALARPLTVAGTEVSVGASIGIAIGLDVRPDELVRQADREMYACKRSRQRTIDVR